MKIGEGCIRGEILNLYKQSRGVKLVSHCIHNLESVHESSGGGGAGGEGGGPDSHWSAVAEPLPPNLGHLTHIYIQFGFRCVRQHVHRCTINIIVHYYSESLRVTASQGTEEARPTQLVQHHCLFTLLKLTAPSCAETSVNNKRHKYPIMKYIQSVTHYHRQSCLDTSH